MGSVDVDVAAAGTSWHCGRGPRSRLPSSQLRSASARLPGPLQRVRSEDQTVGRIRCSGVWSRARFEGTLLEACLVWPVSRGWRGSLVLVHPTAPPAACCTGRLPGKVHCSCTVTPGPLAAGAPPAAGPPLPPIYLLPIPPLAPHGAVRERLCAEIWCRARPHAYDLNERASERPLISLYAMQHGPEIFAFHDISHLNSSSG